FAVADVTAGVGQGAIVAPGQDQVADPDTSTGPAGAVIAQGDGGSGDEPGRDAVGVSAQVQRVDGGAVDGDEQTALAVSGVGVPRVVGGLEHRLSRTGVKSPVCVVRVEAVGVSGAQGARGVGFPAVLETPQ